MRDLILSLPFPPSANTYWRNGWIWQNTPRGRHKVSKVMISEKGREYRKRVWNHVLEQRGIQLRMDGRLEAEVVLFPPDRRVRDLDNYNKPLFDALTWCGIYDDDSLIDVSHHYRGGCKKGGQVLIRLTDAGSVVIPSWATEF